LFLQWRAAFGLEDRGRIGERLGRAGAPRPEGRLAWLHGASAADVSPLFPLIEKLGSAGFNVLASTRQARPAGFAAPGLPPRTLHQFAPLDAPKCIGRFLDHWRPDVILLTPCELWPNLILEASRRKIPLALVNARLSARAFLLWRKMPDLIRELLRRIDLCLAQTEADAERFAKFGAAKAQAAGNAFYDFAPPPADAAALARLAARLGARPAWAAVSTYPGEDEIALEVHRRVARHFPNLVTIIAPRQAKRGLDIARQASKFGLRAQFLHGDLVRGDRESDAAPDVYIAGTTGEAGVFYRTVSVVFLGKSLCRGGGINPIEPAKLGCAILHGPDVDDFEEAYAALDGAGGAGRVFDAEALASELALLLFDAAELRAMARAASDAVERRGGAAKRIMRALEPYLAPAMAPRGPNG
jgi:3-deoxy-D-manno-octulosonic-acid transferase